MARNYTVATYFDAFNDDASDNKVTIDRGSEIVDTADAIKGITDFSDIIISIKISDASFSLTREQYVGYGLAARDHAGGVKTIWRYAQSPVRPALRPV